MGYPKRLLLDGESIVFDLRPHWWYMSKHVAVGVPVVAFGVFSLTLDGDSGKATKYVAGALFVVWLVWFAARLLQWMSTHFVLTTDRLIYRKGLVAKHGRDVPLNRVNNIDMHQTVFERVIKAGDILVESAGTDGQQTFSDIRHPENVQREINRVVEADTNEERGGGRSAAPSVPAQIAELAALRDSGVLSEAEFQAKKADLLGRM
jgi:uncharacterized membrane protein YdbT with pleckstrin-like domain